MVQVNQALNAASNLLTRAVEGLGEQIGKQASAVVRQFNQQHTAASRSTSQPSNSSSIDIALGEGRLRQTLGHTPSLKAQAHQALADATNLLAGKLGLQDKLGAHLPSGSRFIQLERSAQQAVQSLTRIDKDSTIYALKSTSTALKEFAQQLSDYVGDVESDASLDGLKQVISSKAGALDAQRGNLESQLSKVHAPRLDEFGSSLVLELNRKGSSPAQLFRGNDLPGEDIRPAAEVRKAVMEDLITGFGDAVSNHYSRMKAGAEPLGATAAFLQEIGVSEKPDQRAKAIDKLPFELREKIATTDAIVRDHYRNSGMSVKEIEDIVQNVVSSALFLRGLAPVITKSVIGEEFGFVVSKLDSSQESGLARSAAHLLSIVNQKDSAKNPQGVYVREFIKDIIASVAVNPERVEASKSRAEVREIKVAAKGVQDLAAAWGNRHDFSMGRSAETTVVQTAYRKMLEQEHAAENFDFLNAVSEFKDEPSLETALAIVDTFVDDSAARQVNLKFDEVEEIRRGLTNPVDESLFDNASGSTAALLRLNFDHKFNKWLNE